MTPVSKDYLPSSEIPRLAAKIERGYAHITVVAKREMDRLRELSNETICLCKRVGLRKIVVEERTTFQGIKFEYGKGYSSSFHSGATGTVLLSLLDDETVEKLLDKFELVQETPQTIMEKGRILARVSEARQDG